MMNFLIKKDDKINEIVFLEYQLDGYRIKLNAKKSNIGIREVLIVNRKMIESILEKKFNKSFDNILHTTYRAIQSDRQSDINDALNELRRLEDILLDKYQKFLSSEKKKKFLAKLELMKEQLNLKLNEQKPESIEVIIDKLIIKAISVLEDEESTESGTRTTLDELARLKIVLQKNNEKLNNKHKEYMSRIEKIMKQLDVKRRKIQELEVEKRIDSMTKHSKYEKETTKRR